MYCAMQVCCFLILGPAALGQYLNLQASASERACNSKKNDVIIPNMIKFDIGPSASQVPDSSKQKTKNYQRM
jgi:hypothetical protein